MRTFSLILIATAFGIAAASLTTRHSSSAPQQPVVVQSQGPTIERLQRLSALVTSRVEIADVLIGTGDGCKGAFLIRGDALLSIDLSRAEIAAKDGTAKQAMICLPQPEVLQARVNHERTRTWEVRSMVWLPWKAHPDALRDDVMLQAQRMVAQAAASPENIAQAQRSAEAIIAAIYEHVGWHVEVRWNDATVTASEPTAASP